MNSTNYNSLIKLAAAPTPPPVAMGAIKPGSEAHRQLVSGAVTNKAMPEIPGDPRLDEALSKLNEPRWYPNYITRQKTINPATGGQRIAHGPEDMDGGVGPFPVDHRMRQGKLPLIPSSSGKIGPYSLRDARAQADAIQNAQAINEANKRKVSQNFGALFKDLHSTNQARAKAGLPAYQPNAVDVYAPYADANTDKYELKTRVLNDAAMSNLTAEAARRGTPYNPAEINYIQNQMLPRTREQTRAARNSGKLMGEDDPSLHTWNANNYKFPR